MKYLSMKKTFYLVLCFLIPVVGFAQNNPVQDAAIPKDAPVNVTVTDFKNNVLPHEIMIFRSKLTPREYQGLTDDNGKFTVRLPAGDKYEIFILGFKDS